MNIKSQKDFFSGLMFTVVGVAFAWGATTYTVGSGARMGPGYFPLMLGIVMAIIGMIITFTALVTETADGDRIGKWAWKQVFYILADARLTVFGGAARTSCRMITPMAAFPAAVWRSAPRPWW